MNQLLFLLVGHLVDPIADLDLHHEHLCLILLLLLVFSLSSLLYGHLSLLLVSQFSFCGWNLQGDIVVDREWAMMRSGLFGFHRVLGLGLEIFFCGFLLFLMLFPLDLCDDDP